MSLENLEIQSYILYKPQFITGLDQHSYTVTLERRPQIEGEDKWGIYKTSSVLSKSSKEFMYESLPSSRTKKELMDSRFANPQEAYNFWKTQIESHYEMELKEAVELKNKLKQIKSLHS